MTYSELQALAKTNQKQMSQLNENTMVKTEMDLIGDGEDVKVYKQIGPVLVKQSLEEAKQFIDRRIDFVNNAQKKTIEEIEKKQKEMAAVEDKVQEITSKQAARK